MSLEQKVESLKKREKIIKDEAAFDKEERKRAE
jgi:hypothetical protein